MSVELGQIRPDSHLGRTIVELASDSQHETYVEIGTWRGEGSTRCFAEPILNRKSGTFISIESNLEMLRYARLMWSKKFCNRFSIIHGRIVNEDQIFSLDQLRKETSFIPQWDLWYKQDIEAMRSCENILDKLPKKIDVLLLDGGEFSSYAEFQILKNRTKIVILDDTAVLKNKKVRSECLETGTWRCLNDHQNERNGWSVFENLI